MTHAGGRPTKWGQATEWKSIRIPSGDYQHLKGLAQKAGVKLPDAHHALVQELKLGGDPLLRQIVLRAQLDIAERNILAIGQRAARDRQEFERRGAANQKLRATIAGLTRLLHRKIAPERLVQLLSESLSSPEPEPASSSNLELTP